MKRMLLIALLFSSQVFAAEIANYRFGIEDYSNGEHTVHTMAVSLDEDQTMKVVLNQGRRTNSVFFVSTGEEETFQKPLNNFVFKQIIHDVIRLANAPIEKSLSEIVCMMMPGLAKSNDHLSVKRVYDRGTKTFHGEMELVYGPRGCWVPNKVAPKASYDKELANGLKEKLKTLALEFIGHKL